MEKKFTRAMVCKEFHPGKCRECPLNSGKNPKSLPCWLLDESDIQNIMEDYPYADVKVRMIFNDIETRLTAVEKKVDKKDEPKFTMFPVVAKKLYDELEAKHESDCRLISEYDIENKKLEAIIKDLRFDVEKAKSWEKRYKELEYMYEKKDAENNRLEDRYRIHIADLKSKLFDLKNTEEERDYYKRLYSFKCDDYDKLLEKQIKTEKELKHAEEVGDNYKLLYDTTCDNYDKLETKCGYLERENKTFNVLLINKTETIGELSSKNKILEENIKTLEEKYNKLLKDYKLLSESNNNHATDNVELEGELEAKTNRIAALEEKLRNQRTNLASLQEKYEDALKMNKAREDVYYSNIKLKKTIESKDREIGLLRAELDKYKTNDECDDSWID